MNGAILEGLEAADLYGELPGSVRGVVQHLERQGADWNAVGGALAMAPTAGVSLKGGGGWRKDLWEGVKVEFSDFLCNDSAKYQDLRDEWGSLREKSRHLALASLSGVIGAQLGVAAGVVAPLVVWLVLVATRVGKEGLCRALGPGAGANAG